MEGKFAKKTLRLRYYIDHQFQNRFMARFAMIAAIAVVLVIAILWFLDRNAYSSGLLPAGAMVVLDTSRSYSCKVPGDPLGTQELLKPKQYYNAFQLLWKPIVILGFINLAFLVIASLFYSHSMAGPVYRIKKSLRNLNAGGEAVPIQLRRGDQFQELAQLLNELIEKRVK